MKTLLSAILLMLTGALSNASIESYLENDDASYSYEVRHQEKIGGTTFYQVRMVSQTWQGIEWWHWMTIAVPEKPDFDSKALLVISGGSNREDQAPDLDQRGGRLMQALVGQTGSIVAVVPQVPNQPIWDRYEDDLIATTFEKFMRGEGDDWPLLLPMVKSAVRAMDTVQAVAKEMASMEIDGFIVTGASKRGWTTWLTGAHDDRVVGVMPMVIDVLNMTEQMRHMRASYGGYSEQIGDYSSRNLTDALSKTDRGKALSKIVDPFAYRGEIEIPKLILLGTNDPYWTVDAANLYFPHLSGEKHLFYLPNAGHGLGFGVVPSAVSFSRHVMAGENLPEFNWEKTDAGALKVSWGEARPTLTLWRASSDDRDFRDEQWEPELLDIPEDAKTVTVSPDTPEEGYTAYFLTATFTSEDGRDFPLSSQMTVLPDIFQFDDEGNPLPKTTAPEPR